MAFMKTSYPSDNTTNTFQSLVTEIAKEQQDVPEYGLQPVYCLNPKSYTPKFPVPTYSPSETFSYWAIREPQALVDTPIVNEIYLGDNHRLRNVCRMFRFYRFDILIRVDLRVPLGSTKLFKILVLPGDVADITAEDNVVLWPGVMVDSTICTTTFISAPWMNKEYFYDFESGTPSFSVVVVPIGEVDIKTTPVPLSYTISTYMTNVHFAAIRNVVDPTVPIPPQLQEVSEMGLKNLPLQPTETLLADGTRTITWKKVWRFVLQKTPLISEVLFPGTAPFTKAISDFFINVFNLEALTNGGYAAGELTTIYVPLGSILYLDEQRDDGLFVIRIGNKDQTESDYTSFAKYVLCDGTDPENPVPLLYQSPIGPDKALQLSTRTIVNRTFLHNRYTHIPTMWTVKPVDNLNDPISKLLIDVEENPKNYADDDLFIYETSLVDCEFKGTSYYYSGTGAEESVSFRRAWQVGEKSTTNVNLVVPLALNPSISNNYAVVFGCSYPKPERSDVNPGQLNLYTDNIFYPQKEGSSFIAAGTSFKTCVLLGTNVKTGTDDRCAYVFPCFTTEKQGRYTTTTFTKPIFYPVAYNSMATQYVPCCSMQQIGGTLVPIAQYWDMLIRKYESDNIIVPMDPLSPVAGPFTESLGTPILAQEITTLSDTPPKDVVGAKINNPQKFTPKTLGRLSDEVFVQQAATGEVLSEEIAGTSGPTMMANNILAPDVPKIAQFPIGQTDVSAAAEKVWSILGVQVLDDKSSYVLKLNPYFFNFVGSKAPSHAQVEPLRHQWIQPSPKFEFCHFKLTSVANAFSNGRLIIAHVPPSITVDEISKMSIADLSQFNRTEHVLHGPDSILEIKWQRPIPYMDAYSNKDEEHNGHVVFRWVEYVSDSQTTSPPKISSWISIDSCDYAVVRPPRVYTPLTFVEIGAQKIKHQSLQDLKTHLSIKINQLVDDDLARFDLLDALDKY